MLLASPRLVETQKNVFKMKSYFFTIPSGSVYFEVFMSWPRGCVAAIKILVYFTSWQHGRMAATPKKPLQPPNNPFLRLRCHPAMIEVEPGFICGYAATK